MSVPGPGTDYSGGYIRTSGAARTASGDDYDDLYKVCPLAHLHHDTPMEEVQNLFRRPVEHQAWLRLLSITLRSKRHSCD
jgi:hypothetical protein